MLRFFAFCGRQRKVVVLGLAVGFSVWMLALKGSDKLRLATVVSTTLLQGGQRAFSWPIHLMYLQRENERLRRRATQLFVENSILKKAQHENKRLRDLLRFEKMSDFRLVPAEVIGWSGDRTVNSIVINVGQHGGIERNMPVITPDGLVGKVYRVTPRAAVVQLLLDPNCRVSAIVQRSRVLGIMEWERGARCLLRNVPIRNDVAEGDTVVSSGMGGVFPKGLMLGYVSAVRGTEWQLFKEIALVPAVDFTHLEEVFVLINADRERFSAGDRSAANSIDVH